MPSDRAGGNSPGASPTPSPSGNDSVRCHVYGSSVREGLYVYLLAPDSDAPGGDPSALDSLPAPVRRQLGRATLAMTIELDENRRLGQEDVREVLANLGKQGFHVQMPRDIEPIVEAVAADAVSSAARRQREQS